MAAGIVKLTGAEARGLAALGRLAKKIPEDASSAEVRLDRKAPTVEPGEVVVFVMSDAGALVGRTTVHGRTPDVDALRTVWMGADVAAEGLAKVAPAPAPTLATAEAALLDEAGFVEASSGEDPLDRTRIELELLLRDSPTLETAARELKVSTGRLRQRLAPGVRTLYGVKVAGRAWRIPRFQFARRGRLVRNIDRVLPKVSVEAHPLSVASWFSLPHQDLVVGEEERRVSPLAWLEAGMDPSVVANLAGEI